MAGGGAKPPADFVANGAITKTAASAGATLQLLYLVVIQLLLLRWRRCCTRCCCTALAGDAPGAVSIATVAFSAIVLAGNSAEAAAFFKAGAIAVSAMPGYGAENTVAATYIIAVAWMVTL